MMKENPIIKQILNKFESAVVIADSIILFFIVLIVCIQVIGRFLNISLAGTEALAQYGYVIFVFLAWSVAALRGNDVSVRVLFDKFSSQVRKWVLVLFSILMAGFTALTLKSALLNAENSALVSSPNLDWFKMSYLYYAVAFCLFLTCIMNIVRAIRLARGIDVYKTEKEVFGEQIKHSLETEGVNE